MGKNQEQAYEQLLRQPDILAYSFTQLQGNDGRTGVLVSDYDRLRLVVRSHRNGPWRDKALQQITGLVYDYLGLDAPLLTMRNQQVCHPGSSPYHIPSEIRSRKAARLMVISIQLDIEQCE